MNEDVKPLGGPEPRVSFRMESDRDCWEIINPDLDKVVMKISGYDLQCWFNHEYLQSIEAVEAACNGIHNLFRELILEQILAKSKQNKPE